MNVEDLILPLRSTHRPLESNPSKTFRSLSNRCGGQADRAGLAAVWLSLDRR